MTVSAFHKTSDGEAMPVAHDPSAKGSGAGGGSIPAVPAPPAPASPALLALRSWLKCARCGEPTNLPDGHYDIRHDACYKDAGVSS